MTNVTKEIETDPATAALGQAAARYWLEKMLRERALMRESIDKIPSEVDPETPEGEDAMDQVFETEDAIDGLNALIETIEQVWIND